MTGPTDRLEAYRRRRDFRRTSEPPGAAARDGSGDALYVLHKHAARNLHFDLRLEQDGVLRSWALPKGPSLKPGEKRLAVQVEDHPLEYGDFEGVISKKAYGGGTVMLWDRGHWRSTGEGGDGRFDFVLEGEKLRGAWTLVRMTGRRSEGGKNWLLIKRRDEGRRSVAAKSAPAENSVATGRSMKQIERDGDRVWTRRGEVSAQDPVPPDPAALDGARKQALNKLPRPVLATLARKPPDGPGWIHEIKFDGYRVMARVEEGEIRLVTRNGHDWTRRFPELAAHLEKLPVERALLDGEVVALIRDGTSSFGKLQEILNSGNTDRLVYQVFDLLHLNGYALDEVPLIARKRALAQLIEAAGFDAGGTVRYTDHVEARGAVFFEQACRLGLEGIISKRSASRYRSGRGKEWLKMKCGARDAEFVVGGFTDPGGARSGFGSLLLGAYGDNGELVYAGRVGTGFSERQLQALHARLSDDERPESPFHDSVPDVRRVHWVYPQLVVEVEFTEWTRDGRLRHPSFRGVRDDRDPGEIRLTRGNHMASAIPSDDSRPRTGGDETVAGIRLTHPQRILYPGQGITKLGLARYYEEIQDWILPHVIDRPLSLLRCPQGRSKQCFFQKHPREAIAASVPRVEIEEKEGQAEYVHVRSVRDLVALVQAGVLELHPWGCRVDDVEHPDIMVFDLDPAPEVAWAKVLRVARELCDRLENLGLVSFVRTTGGKGLHLVVPLEREAGWDEVKAFARAVSQRHAGDDPKRLTINMSKAKRRGRIFIDYLRNGRGATAIASYSTRAREGAPVAVPLRWDELTAALRSDRYHIGNVRRRLAALHADPWDGFAAARRPITEKMRRAVGLK